MPIDAPGLRLIARPAGRPGESEAPFSSRFGQSTALLVFEDVFVPWEQVFLCGEHAYAGPLAEAFANHHRQSCTGCRAGLGDMIVGAASALADANGLPAERVSHLRNDLAQLIRIVEGFFATGVAAAVYGRPTGAGNYEPDPVQSNLGKWLLAEQVYDLFRIAHDIAGGIVVNVPLPEELTEPRNAALIEKYYAGRAGVGAGERLALARLLKDLTASGEAGWYAVISAHGGGSPEALRLSTVRGYDLKQRQDLAPSGLFRALGVRLRRLRRLRLRGLTSPRRLPDGRATPARCGTAPVKDSRSPNGYAGSCPVGPRRPARDNRGRLGRRGERALQSDDGSG